MSDSFEDLRASAAKAAEELCEVAKLAAGQLVVVGCSSSEIAGQRIGSASNPDIGTAVFESVYRVFHQRGVFLAAQCCEHLNRALIVERDAVPLAEAVNVVPLPKAGGSFAAAAYKAFLNPVAIEEIKADAGLDIGNTMIGMHLKRVAIPIRLSVTRIGEAPVTAARTRPKYIGGANAVYDNTLA